MAGILQIPSITLALLLTPPFTAFYTPCLFTNRNTSSISDSTEGQESTLQAYSFDTFSPLWQWHQHFCCYSVPIFGKTSKSCVFCLEEVFVFHSMSGSAWFFKCSDAQRIFKYKYSTFCWWKFVFLPCRLFNTRKSFCAFSSELPRRHFEIRESDFVRLVQHLQPWNNFYLGLKTDRKCFVHFTHAVSSL